MNWLDHSLTSPADNLALDEALLIAAEQGGCGEVLRIWEMPTPCVVLGAAGVLAQDVNDAPCQADKVPILRRSSGGGTVLLCPGCLVYSLVLAYDRAPELTQVGSSYCYIFDRIIQALAVPGLACAGVSDLALDALKVSGNSQQRKRHHLLHHGTLLYAFDLGKIARYLPMPSRQPDYRQQRHHQEFLTNLPLSRPEIVARLRSAFGADHKLHDWPAEEVRRLVADKYTNPEWIHRR